MWWLPDSSARSSGDCANELSDQRGFPRTPNGLGCDSGAYEADAFPNSSDVNASGTVTNDDVQAVLVWLAGGPTPADLSAGDVNNDGAVNLADALALAQFLTGG